VKSTVSHVAVAATALLAGGAGALAFSNPEAAHTEAAASAPPAPPEQVRTVVVTRTIHRIRHVRVHHKPVPVVAAAPPAPVAAAPAVVSRPVAVAPRQQVVQPLKTRTSGHGSGGHGEGEHEGGGDD
jgi:hypothetical protein